MYYISLCKLTEHSSNTFNCKPYINYMIHLICRGCHHILRIVSRRAASHNEDQRHKGIGSFVPRHNLPDPTLTLVAASSTVYSEKYSTIGPLSVDGVNWFTLKQDQLCLIFWYRRCFAAVLFPSAAYVDFSSLYSFIFYHFFMCSK